jgi:hypothetical protein
LAEAVDRYLTLDLAGSFTKGQRIEVDIVSWDGGYNGSGYHWTFKDAYGLCYLYGSTAKRPYKWPGMPAFTLRATVSHLMSNPDTGLRGYYIERPKILEEIQIQVAAGVVERVRVRV